jgi:hypothetical protein
MGNRKFEPESKDLYLEVALRQIPRILTYMDTDVTSPTYGCFDREYWHYRTMDFPCGMSQEFVLPLALVYRHRFRDNLFYENEKVRQLVVVGIHFAARSSHRDGSCDDYFPYERAYGATAFSLYAMTEAYLLLGIKDGHLLEFMKKRGDWLCLHLESGRLANHQAVAALALQKLGQVTGDERYRKSAQEKIGICLSWQSEEGWFYEYQGCDPGYLTMTIDFLAQYNRLSQDLSVSRALEKALEFLDHFVYPDGTCGGEIGSRDTYIFMPHGLELLAPHHKRAHSIKGRYLRCLGNRKEANFEDSRIFGHMTYSHLMAWLDFCETSEGERKREDYQRYFQESQLLVSRRGPYYLACSLSKGGVFKLFHDDELIVTDSGPVCVFHSGKVGVSNRMAKRRISLNDGIQVMGPFHYFRKNLATPSRQILFRLALVLLGRLPFLGEALRRIFQRILILGKKEAPASFKRRLKLKTEGLSVEDVVSLLGKGKVEKLFISTDKVSIYVAMSECFHLGSLLPWQDCESHVAELNSQKHTVIRREFR